ncbi:MAG: DUF367 family protein [Candidatus Thorarchaeota archaeon]
MTHFIEMPSHSKNPRVIIYHANQCDPKKCTGLRLGRLHRAEIIKDLKRIPRGAVVLNPVADTAVSLSDRDSIMHSGLVALDCSWNCAEEIFHSSIGGVQRALPYLLAGNPINTYKPVKLSTAEAIAASLYIINLKELAEDVMSVFKWGPSFLTLNQEWLDAYSACRTSTEVVNVQAEIMAEHSRPEENELRSK